MSRKKTRATYLAVGLGVVGVALGIVLYALQDTLVFFRTPTDVAKMAIEPGQRFRLGGLVAENSFEKGTDARVTFQVTDTESFVPVTYRGVLPDLFREGQGVVTEGALNSAGVFVADKVLAKHDENYMPPEVAAALKDKGVWQGAGEGAAPRGSAADVSQPGS